MNLTALAYIISSIWLAFSSHPSEPVLDFAPVTDTGIETPLLLAAIFLLPTGPATWASLAAIWVTVSIFLIQTIRSSASFTLVDLALMTGAFLAGAIWPWIALIAPLLGFLISVLMLLALITAVSRENSDGQLARNPSVGIFLGWTTILTFTAFAAFIGRATSIPIEFITIASATLACTSTIAIQMRIPKNPYYTASVILSLLALAAAMIEAAPTLSVIAVLSMAALTFLLVRVTT